MIRLCTDTSELDFLPPDPFCAVITALGDTYPADRDFIRFYLQGEDAALSIIDGNANLWCGENADTREIADFIEFAGIRSLRSDISFFEKAGIKQDDSSYIVKYVSAGKPEEPDNFRSEADYKEIFNLLTAAGFEMGSYSAFLEDICARMNKGTCRGGFIYAGSLQCCAFRLFEGRKSALMGAVATDPGCRGRGLASSLVPYMAQGEKDSFLFCRNDSLLDFYEKCGFEYYGKWATKFFQGE